NWRRATTRWRRPRMGEPRTTRPQAAASTSPGSSGSEAARPLLEVKDLRTHFPIRRGAWGRVRGHVRAVDGVSLHIARGETLGLVGESGCGKSTLGRSVLRLLEPTSGSVALDGVELTTLTQGALRPLRRKMQMVFQDPYGSLNPRMTVGEIVGEPFAIHRVASGEERRR